MWTTFIEMPSGATSKPHEFLEEAPTRKLFDRFVAIMHPWKQWRAEVVLTESGKEIQREQILNV